MQTRRCRGEAFLPAPQYGPSLWPTSVSIGGGASIASDTHPTHCTNDQRWLQFYTCLNGSLHKSCLLHVQILTDHRLCIIRHLPSCLLARWQYIRKFDEIQFSWRVRSLEAPSLAGLEVQELMHLPCAGTTRYLPGCPHSLSLP